MELGASVVREVAKMGSAARNTVTYDEARDLVTVKLQGRDAFAVRPAAVRAADTSAAAIDEWTGERVGAAAAPEGVKPSGVSPVGNYAVQIVWDDGFNQVAPFEVLAGLESQKVEGATVAFSVGGLQATAELTG
jgi:DUF971 family protein